MTVAVCVCGTTGVASLFCVACSYNHLADPEFLPVAPLLLRLLELVLAVGEAGFLFGGPGCGGGQMTRSTRISESATAYWRQEIRDGTQVSGVERSLWLPKHVSRLIFHTKQERIIPEMYVRVSLRGSAGE